MNCLTVGELKEFLSSIPDSYHVCLDAGAENLFDIISAEKIPDGQFAIGLTCPSAWDENESNS